MSSSHRQPDHVKDHTHFFFIPEMELLNLAHPSWQAAIYWKQSQLVSAMSNQSASPLQAAFKFHRRQRRRQLIGVDAVIVEAESQLNGVFAFFQFFQEKCVHFSPTAQTDFSVRLLLTGVTMSFLCFVGNLTPNMSSGLFTFLEYMKKAIKPPSKLGKHSI